eukprot:15361782-Ditylum_brightwellii.AAC.2
MEMYVLRMLFEHPEDRPILGLKLAPRAFTSSFFNSVWTEGKMEEIITMSYLLYTPTFGGGTSSSLEFLSTAAQNLPLLLPVDPERLQFDAVLTQDSPEEIVGGFGGGS